MAYPVNVKGVEVRVYQSGRVYFVESPFDVGCDRRDQSYNALPRDIDFLSSCGLRSNQCGRAAGVLGRRSREVTGGNTGSWDTARGRIYI